MNKQQRTWGGKREGAGRKPEGKAAYNLTLTAENVQRAKEKEANFSRLMDRLLSAWLRRA